MQVDRRSGLPRALTVVALLGLILFTVLGIGGPLLGHGVFAGTDEMVTNSPYRDAGLAESPVRNTYLDDTYDTIIPNTLLFADALRDGEIARWNPYILGGTPLGSTPNFAVASPLTVPYYLLPGPLAPAWVKLLEIAVAVAGCFLFLRRVGISRPAALVGGLVFAASAFQIAWTNWPQTRTAAVIPFVFWAVERLVRHRRLRDAAVLSLPVAAMLFGGFPAITGYALLLAGVYLLVRTVAEHRRGQWWRDIRLLAAGGLGVLGGFALAAFQLLPFASALSGSLVQGRGQTPADHLPHEALITAIAPFALGTVEPQRPPPFALSVNLVEALSYVGAGALVLVVLAMASPRAGRSVLPAGLWSFLVAGLVVTGFVIYAGGWPLAVLQQLPVLFSDNSIGRARSVLGFLVAVLAAVGLDTLLRRPGRGEAPRRGLLLLGYGAAVWAAVAVLGYGVWRDARSAAWTAEPGSGVDRVAFFDQQVLTGLAFLGAALACVLALWLVGLRAGPPGRGRGAVRLVAAALLPILIAVQGVTMVRDYWSRSDRATFYPVTDVQRYLQDGLGHERFAFALGGMAVGADAPLRLRALNGHTFLDARFAELVEQLPGRQFGVPSTYPVLGHDPGTATSPVLDRLGTRYFVMSPAHPVPGVFEPAPGDGTTQVLRPGDPVRVPVPGGLRGVGLTPDAAPAVPDEVRLRVELHDQSGRTVASAVRSGHGMVPGEPFIVPVAAEDLPDALTATITLDAGTELVAQASDGAPAVSTVRAADDGLRLAFAGPSVVYERLNSAPRIRWASETVVEPEPARRLELLTSGTLRPEQVVLDVAGPAAGQDPGGQANVRVVRDGFDEIVVDVDAVGSGHLVVADALQNGWRAEVDGRAAELVAADHGVVAVPVPPGEHRVRLFYSSPQEEVGTWISAATALTLLAVGAAAVVGGFVARRTRGSDELSP